MKRKLSALLCLGAIVLLMSACREEKVMFDDNASTTASTEVMQKPTEEKAPVDILKDAGLTQELIDMYFFLTDTGGLQIRAEDFVRLANLGDDLMQDYFYTFGFDYSVDKYIEMVEDLKNNGLTETQISNYGSFVDMYTLDEYIKMIKDMVEAGLTEHQISNYAWHTDIKPEKYIYVYNNLENPDDVISYYYFFSMKYSFDEYMNLFVKLREITGEPSAVPIYPLSDTLVFVRRNISTYDYVEESIAILTIDGEYVSDWNADWVQYDIQHRAECGDYFFIMTKAHYNHYTCDVVNRNGQIIASIDCKENRYNIGDGYVFFTFGGDWGQIMNPQGEVIELQKASVSPSYGNKSNGALEDDDEIGNISEGLFFGYSSGNTNTVAYYYNTKGEVVIDLSTRAVNFKVTKMYDFSNGQAKIEFIGADYKNYYAFIDKTGAFVGEPVEIAE